MAFIIGFLTVLNSSAEIPYAATLSSIKNTLANQAKRDLF